jgi:NADH-quinone oxidoreductase subunit G
MPKQISLTINEHPVTVPEGTLIVNAAKRIGINIPVFCYHPKMEPVGMCRQCLVEVGRPMIDRATRQPVLEDGRVKIQFGGKLETACTTPVSEGMVVLTSSEKAKAGQNDNLEFLLTSHPLDCPVCDKGGECPLQNLTMAYGPDESRFLYDDKMHLAKALPLGELIYLDRERCIQCARCVRFQDEVAGESVIRFFQRGRELEIITDSDPGFDSVFSGNTTDICPVGALTTADFRFGARPWEMKAAASVCAQCPVGCNITFNTRREAKADGKVVIKRVMPRQNEAVNEIWMCDKGRFAYHFTESPKRLSLPLVKISSKQEVVEWKDALDLAARKFLASKGETVVLAGGRLSNEDLFQLKQLADGLGGKAVLYTQMGGGELTCSLGVGAGTNFADMGKGTTILVAGSDLYHEAPVWYLRIKQAVERGATLVVVAPRATKLEKYASHVVRYVYGDEAETMADLLKSKPAQAVSEAISSAENLVILYGSEGMGLEGSSALAAACATLLVETKHFGRPNNGLIGVWPKANDQGAWEIGFRPEEDLVRLFKGKAVYIAAADPAGDDPALAAALQEAKFVAVQELFLTATAELADVVLPAQAYTERDGSFTSAERRVQRFYPAVPVRGEAREDFAITAQIAGRAGVKLEQGSALRVMDRLAAAIPVFAGLSYRRLAEVAEQWPMVGRSDLYFGGTLYENTQGLGVQLAPSGSAGENVSIPPVKRGTALRPQEETYLAVPVTRLYDRGITVSASGLLRARIGEAEMRVHPSLAEKLGLDGRAEIRLNGSTLELKVTRDENVPASVALLPRSMGIPIAGPTVVTLKASKGEGGR